MTKRLMLVLVGSLFMVGPASAQVGGFIGFNCGHGGFGTPTFATYGGTAFTPVFTPVVGTTTFTPVFTPVVAAPTTGAVNGTTFTPVLVAANPTATPTATGDTPMFVVQFKPPVLPEGQKPKDPTTPQAATLTDINETLKRIEGHLKTIAEKRPGGGGEVDNTAATRGALAVAIRQLNELDRKPAAPTLADRLKEADRVLAALAARK